MYANRAPLVAAGCYAIFSCLLTMSRLEQTIRRYEHMRWAQEPNRRVLPFAWGLEHIGGDANDPDPRGFLNRFVETILTRNDDWYAATPASDYALKENVLTFTSAIVSPWKNSRTFAAG